MPLQRRLPKRGFHNPFRVETAIVNLEQLEAFPSGSEVTPALLVEKGLLRSKNQRVKILSDGALTNH
jgi:large subunit ribosomal protein L15